MAPAPMAVKTRKPVRSRSSGSPPRRRRRVVEAVLVFIGCILMIDALFGERGMVAMMRARTEARALEQQLSAIQAESARLHSEIKRLHEPAAIEDLARRQLGLIKRGEKLVMLKDVTPEDLEGPR